jgi:hypothetical protein
MGAGALDLHQGRLAQVITFTSQLSEIGSKLAMLTLKHYLPGEYYIVVLELLTYS